MVETPEAPFTEEDVLPVGSVRATRVNLEVVNFHAAEGSCIRIQFSDVAVQADVRGNGAAGQSVVEADSSDLRGLTRLEVGQLIAIIVEAAGGVETRFVEVLQVSGVACGEVVDGRVVLRVGPPVVLASHLAAFSHASCACSELPGPDDGEVAARWEALGRRD
jgi:hypothetical protein